MHSEGKHYMIDEGGAANGEQENDKTGATEEGDSINRIEILHAGLRWVV